MLEPAKPPRMVPLPKMLLYGFSTLKAVKGKNENILVTLFHLYEEANLKSKLQHQCKWPRQQD